MFFDKRGSGIQKVMMIMVVTMMMKMLMVMMMIITIMVMMLMVLAMMMMVLMMMQWSADDRFWQVLQLKFKQRNSIVQPSSKYANKGHKYIIQM